MRRGRLREGGERNEQSRGGDREGDVPISSSLSNLPGRLNAGSIAFGRFVAAITTTLGFSFSFLSPSSPPSSSSSSSSSSSLSSSPSINVNNCATTLLSTSPPSSLFGAKASTSSITIMLGLAAFAAWKILRNSDSVSPW